MLYGKLNITRFSVLNSPFGHKPHYNEQADQGHNLECNWKA